MHTDHLEADEIWRKHLETDRPQAYKNAELGPQITRSKHYEIPAACHVAVEIRIVQLRQLREFSL